ncbi:hypothetical protein ABI_13450 [Asticcacaulis biprosthecium C19]|uniref:Uncharacterized protein n=1 Tax=Asticcacaulis biprosthecium C19 TaxID=715226 RepID=F4QI40_9CAUL|nr:hypothetical protein [Asticcacaulis biprosthecium]EGF92907.1 hypothetical protein ABI_13450 [Asticcacaulis biprosthecium C19]
MTVTHRIGAVVVGEGEEVRLAFQTVKAGDVVDLRHYGTFGAAKTYMATGKGVTVAVGKIADLIRLLQEAEAKAHDLGLLTDSTG